MRRVAQQHHARPVQRAALDALACAGRLGGESLLRDLRHPGGGQRGELVPQQRLVRRLSGEGVVLPGAHGEGARVGPVRVGVRGDGGEGVVGGVQVQRGARLAGKLGRLDLAAQAHVHLVLAAAVAHLHARAGRGLKRAAHRAGRAVRAHQQVIGHRPAGALERHFLASDVKGLCLRVEVVGDGRGVALARLVHQELRQVIA
mmetsp:Transcript_9870/g.24649  ORF Transcript_9870/g.24649 Transcript_9870/m.24649 type:complete len:202 (+) Transcript_9870:693-1298(+)